MSLVDFTNFKQCESVESGKSLRYVFIEDAILTVHTCTYYMYCTYMYILYVLYIHVHTICNVHTCTYYMYCTYMYIHVLYLHKHVQCNSCIVV